MSPPTPSDPLSVVYATDEHLAIRAAGDFRALAPDWQTLAQGADGSFDPGSPWTLSSASVDFEAAGVGPGCVVELSGPRAVFRGSGLLFAAEAAAGGSLTLRPIGRAAGSSPIPAEGLAGVTFAVPSLGPQVEEASWDLNRRFAIDARTPGRTPLDLLDLRDLRTACVLSVLIARYAGESRAKDGDFRRKAELYRAELSEVLARLTVRWLPTTPGGRRSGRFTTRLER